MKKSIFILPLLPLLVWWIVLYANPDGRSGRTGGGGQSNCTGCHGTYALNSGGGSVTISSSNMPGWTYTPGTTYTMRISVVKTGAANFGVDATAFTSANVQTGTMAAGPNGDTQIMSGELVQLDAYGATSICCINNGSNGHNYDFYWTAPASNVGNITFYFTGLAGNYSGGTSGDYVYTASQVITPAGAAVCNPPGTLGTSGVSAAGATLSWAAVSTASSYNIQYKISGGATWTTTTSTTTSKILTGLTGSTTYQWQVQAVCPSGSSTYAAGPNFTTLASCTTPTGLTASTVTTSSATVGWTAVSGAISYNIQYRLGTSGTFTTVTSTTNSKSLTGLVAGSLYQFQIQAVCSSGSSSYSSLSTFTTTSNSGGSITRGPYMLSPTDSSINIQWVTSAVCNSEVRWDTVRAVVDTATRLRYIGARNAASVTDHQITIRGLKPNTKYWYSVGSYSISSSTKLQGDTSNYFITAPIKYTAGSNPTLRFWVTGDFGDGSTNQTNVRNSFVTWWSTKYDTIVRANIWLGDNAYSCGTIAEYDSKVFGVYNTTSTLYNVYKRLPILPTPGNHDYGSECSVTYQSSAARGYNAPYFSLFAIDTNATRYSGKVTGSTPQKPVGTEKYWSVNYGPIHFISLDSYGSYNSSGTPMYTWLQDDLAAIDTSKTKWTIAFWHHPPYSKGSHNDDETELTDMRTNINPVLEAAGVDMVLCGHSHIYERSLFIKGFTGLSATFNSALYPTGNIVQVGTTTYSKSTSKGNGTVYAVIGCSGQESGDTQRGYPHLAMAYSSVGSTSFYTPSTGTIYNGSGLLDLVNNGKSLRLTFIDSNGYIRDQVTINKTYTGM